MPSGTANVSERHQQQEQRHEVWLLGQPPLGGFLKFVRDKVIDGKDILPRQLADEWRQASDYYYELEETEAGVADQIGVRDLNPAMIPLAERVQDDKRFQRAFDTLPTSFGMVELDRLIAFQLQVTREFVDSLKA